MKPFPVEVHHPPLHNQEQSPQRQEQARANPDVTNTGHRQGRQHQNSRGLIAQPYTPGLGQRQLGSLVNSKEIHKVAQHHLQFRCITLTVSHNARLTNAGFYLKHARKAAAFPESVTSPLRFLSLALRASWRTEPRPLTRAISENA